MAPKPSEVKAVAAVLDQEHGSAVDAAKAAIKALEDIRRDQRSLVIVRWEGFPLVVGPFSTPRQVQKALERGLGGSKWWVGYTRTAESFDAVREALEGHAGASTCEECSHPHVAHWDKRWKDMTGTWHKPGCLCGCERTF